MTALERGMDMMHMPIKDLPKKARLFAKVLCDEVGGCMEVYITAYTVYAQLEEGLHCDDELYLPRPKDVDWFRTNVIPD